MAPFRPVKFPETVIGVDLVPERMEAHGSPFAETAQQATGLLPDAAAESAMETVGVDRMDSLMNAIHAVCRSGTLSIIGVYGGAADPTPMMDLFAKNVTLQMGQAHVKRWVPELLSVLEQDEDVFGTEDLTSHRIPLQDAPRGYEIFQKKEDNETKVVLNP